ncbi:hypothetical protein H920_01122 [Fukomys damarensis]|uniref:Uncharacterized protein n=1 Tax=Fukomys damarensis TaxID=885580 RepID=A0A091EP47_FUKDA|nr:hypothetical protein H920_01122 [Fukomys damarensis]
MGENSAALFPSKIRTEITAHTAMKENQELMSKIAELDEKLQKCTKESKEYKKQVSDHRRKHADFITQLQDCLHPDQKDQKASDEDLIFQLRELCRENVFMKGQTASLEETINVHEMEAKANRDTEAGRKLQPSLEDHRKRHFGEDSRNGQPGREQDEEGSQLESQVSELVEQLGNEFESHRKTLQRALKAESRLEPLQGQLTDPEGEVVSGEVLRDNVNFEKQNMLSFWISFQKKIKLNQMAAELGFDMRLDVVLARTEQLVRLESNAVIENKNHPQFTEKVKDSERKDGEQRAVHESPLSENSPAGGGEAVAHCLGCGEGRGPTHQQEA